jgi:MFS family permease
MSKKATTAKKTAIYSVSLLGAIGTGLQNYTAVVAFLQSFITTTSRTVMGVVQSVALVFGGICSSLVNFFINIELLDSFWERITQKNRPHLKGWQKFRYWAGSALFVGTGILFGLTALAFAPTGAFAIIGLIAGIFVATIMIIQELETWLDSFDNPPTETPKKSLKERFSAWRKSLTAGKILGTVISIGNVVALSLLFTMGLASFFIGLGVPALPAVIVGFSVAFTGGAFTEFYFYNRFLSDFCDKLKTNWHKMWQTQYPLVGLSCGIANAVVNGALSYAAILMITSLLTAASIAIPPFGLIIAIAATAAVFASAASFILGLDFWIRNSEKLTSYFKKGETANITTEESASHGNTSGILQKLTPRPESVVAPQQPPVPEKKPAPAATIVSLHFVAPTLKAENDPVLNTVPRLSAGTTV